MVQIATCLEAIEGLSKALVPSLLAFLEAIAAGNRSASFQEQQGECSGDVRQQGNLGGDTPADNGDSSRFPQSQGNGHVSKRLLYTWAVQFRIGAQVMQPKSSKVMQPHLTWAMQPSVLMAVQPHHSWAIQPGILMVIQPHCSMSNAAPGGVSTAAFQPQWPWLPREPFPCPPTTYHTGTKRPRRQQLSSDSDETDEEEVNPYLPESEHRDLLSDSDSNCDLESEGDEPWAKRPFVPMKETLKFLETVVDKPLKNDKCKAIAGRFPLPSCDRHIHLSWTSH